MSSVVHKGDVYFYAVEIQGLPMEVRACDVVEVQTTQDTTWFYQNTIHHLEQAMRREVGGLGTFYVTAFNKIGDR